MRFEGRAGVTTSGGPHAPAAATVNGVPGLDGTRPPAGTGAVGPAPVWPVPAEHDERGSFEAFYAGSAARLAAQLYLVTGDVEEARDCVQEAFARAWLHWGTLEREAADPFAWVFTVGYRIAVSRFRRRMAFSRALRRTLPPPPMPGPSPEVIVVRDALATLPHGQRAALVLHYYAGLPVDAIADTLGISPSGVKSRLARGRAALAPLLAEEVTR
jgi:RNA polymerase sigma-70 factor (ECF subfamily)